MSDTPTWKPEQFASGAVRTVTLKSGGTLTVAATMDVFKLSPEDREFVFGLIDKLAQYEKPPG